jgi:hypothetical protein
MKFTPVQTSILKNFATINPSQFIYKDKFLTSNIESSVVAKFDTSVDFGEFDKIGIYDLPQFINILSTFGEDYDIVVKDNMLEIKSGNNKVNYILSNNILQERELDLSKLDSIFSIESDLSFDLTQDKIAIINRILSVMSDLKKVYIIYNHKSNTLHLSVEVEKEISMNSYVQELKDFKCKSKEDKKIMITKDDFILLMKDKDYKVSVSFGDKYAKVNLKSDSLAYVMAAKYAENEY